MNALLSTSSLSEGEIEVLFWATLGGIIVFIGLMLEKFADCLNDRFLGDAYKPHKTLELSGWWLLMLGIFIEIAVAGWSANDAWQTRQMAIKNDPLNQPIAFLTASVSLMNLGTNQTNIDPGKPLGGAVFVKLRFGCSKHPEKRWIAEITCVSCVNNALFPGRVGSTNIIGSVWLLEFGPSGMGRFTSVIPPKTNVRDANEWDAVEFDAPFLPPGTEIWGGDIKLTINSTEKRFEIPPQKIQKAEKIPPTEEQKAQGTIFTFISPAITNGVVVISW